ncbi:MAG: PQQ-dependent sugar dehydrogenase [Bacteroidales bacterium]|nr:PQQ-dependent sugar dehydrogenase [Bacteroidales bacterium]
MKKLVLLFTIVVFFSSDLIAQPQITLESFATGLNNPVSMSHAGDSRLFVVERSGVIKIVDQNGNINSTPFLDISGRVQSGGEQGLLGLAFHPDYASNGYFYVNYTGQADSTHISRFSVSESDPDVADPGSESVMLTIHQPYTNHNGGDVRFGPDGYLYISTGDGGSAGDPQNNAQDLGSLLGKLLRIDVAGNPYGIPPHNPFVDDPAARDEIWAWGLRNPWRISFDSETGDLWIADVGQNEYEEINFEPAGSNGGVNYGWRCYEGHHEYNTQGCESQEFYTFPVHEYSHTATGGCSVTGGFIYRGDQYENLLGHYVFADYCNDKLWTLYNDSGNWELTQQGQYTGNNFSTFGQDANGELYIAGISSGIIYHIKDTTTTGINETHKPQWLNVYPNPVYDELTVKTNGNVSNQVKLTITNVNGQVMMREQIKSGVHTISMESFSPGVYILRGSDGENVTVKRVLLH